MAANREEILADFQACTGIENFEECLAHLEQNQWDLQRAVVSVMGAQEPESVPDSMPEELPPAPTVQGLMPSVVQFSGVTPCTSVPRAFEPHRSRSPPPPSRVRMLEFNIAYQDTNTELVVEDFRTVGTVKELLSASLNIPAEKMMIGGWGHAKPAPSDSEILSTLELPLKNVLYVLTPGVPTTGTDQANGQEPSYSEKLTRSFELIITDTDLSQEYRLRYEGCKTILNVKQGISALTNVSVRHQQWRGWPDESDSLTLAASGISFPNHNLFFCRPQNHNKTDQPTTSREGVNISDSEDDVPEMDIDDTTIFSNEYSSRKFEPLLPADIENETDGLIQFSHEFSSRYGETHPQFYMGPLEDAVREAFSGAAIERKLLAIYIHSDKSVQSNVFCSQLLCAESIVNFLTQNFVTWAWDVTAEENKERLLNTCTKLFGSVTTATVRNLNQDKFPLLLIVMRIRSNTEVFSVLQGNTGIDEMMTSLIHAVDMFTEQRQTEIEQENDRRAAEQLKQEQDAAYQASLMADRAKEQERIKQEKEDQRLKEQEEQEIREREAEQKALLQSLEQQLANEPSEDCPDPMTTLRMRVPSGDMLTRRFLADQAIRMVLVYLGTKGYHTEQYKVLTTFPKKDLTLLDSTETLKGLGLCPQETLFIEER
ncbi:FAS-associated factor 1-like [Asterias rubens]|uniref:FAS-associated factor 1-like n=1 Tax=Asterias rubens TaxID=7604 RepID=UPI00145506C8|nr:FAS-associated factor 1-like [Asterias rubens]